MKIEESLDYFKRRKKMYLHDTCQQHEDNAIQALEKQIPKEPVVLLKDEEGYAYQFEHYLCPDCKNIFEQRPQGSRTPLHIPKHCPDCGQRLK